MSALLLVILIAVIKANLGELTPEELCSFDATVINSGTKAKFPVDDQYCWCIRGSIRLDETTDISHQELTELLRYVAIITGTLEIVNTTFHNVSFFQPLFAVKNEQYKEYAMSIVNNSKLETMGGGALLIQAYGIVRIEDNPRFDPNCTHTLQEYATNRRIRGNRLNCGCELDTPLKSTNIDSIADDCDPLFGRLVFDGIDIPSADVLSKKFRNARNLTGELIVTNTNLANLSFLSNLRNITSIYNASAEFAEKFVKIENNTGLQRLGWANFEGVIGSTVRIVKNPNLCFTVIDLNGLLGTEYVNRIEGTICKEIPPTEHLQRVCRIAHDTGLASLPADCGIIVGGIILDNNTLPTDLWKLYNVTYIYGGLTVLNSTLTGFSPMWKVERIFNPSSDDSALVVESNPNLRSVFLFDLNQTLSDRPVRLKNNKALVLSDFECKRLSRSTKVDSSGNSQNCPEVSVAGVLLPNHVLLVVSVLYHSSFNCLFA